MAELEAQLEEMENQPSAANLIQQERDIRSRLVVTERELAEQSDKLQQLQALLLETEVRLCHALLYYFSLFLLEIYFMENLLSLLIYNIHIYQE